MKSVRLIALATTLTALAAGSAWAGRAAAPVRPTPQDLVAARQAGMGMSVPTLGAMSNAATNGASPRSVAFQARSLARWADAMPALFAPSTARLESRAKPEVWSDAAGFAARAKAFQDATKAVVAASEADNKDGFATALASVKTACKGCHDSYQAPPPAPHAPKAG